MSLFRNLALAAGALALTACENLTRPAGPTPLHPGHAAQESFTCTVTVSTHELSCAVRPKADTPSTSLAPSSLLRFDKIIGGQDVYVKLTSSGTTYDSGTEILSSNVTVQNLTQTIIGTSDGTTVTGVSVFFASDPAVTSGTGTVTVANADGVGTFTTSNQPYFSYQERLEPYQISAGHNWQFSVPATVNTFQFTVYVSTAMVDENAALVDAVWSGAASTDWLSASNWQNGVVPADTSVVAVPRASLLAGGASQPTLVADDTVSDLRVGSGSTLTLGGHRLTIVRNVDAEGTITGGTVHLSGATSLVGGNLPALEIDGAAQLQRPTVTDGAVSVTGSLSIQGTSLSIAIP